MGNFRSRELSRTSLKRLLNLHGGFTDHVLDYSRAAALVIVPHVVGSEDPVGIKLTSWDSIIEHTQFILSFGGMAPKNFQIDSGGMGVHRSNDWMKRVRAAGIGVVYTSSMRSDISDVLAATWLSSARYRHSDDAWYGAYPLHRGTSRPRFPRSLLRRLRQVRPLFDGG